MIQSRDTESASTSEVQEPVQAFFSSSMGPGGLRHRVLEFLDEAEQDFADRRVDLHVMTFSFTDRGIADRLVELARRHPNFTIRIVGDWSQGAPQPGRRLRRLASLRLPNLLVRYKGDQPYRWDSAGSRLRWSYHTSRGLLHHKTLGVRVDGLPASLLCGTYNWTSRAERSYENVLVLSGRVPCISALITRIDLEFASLFSDGEASFSPEEATEHFKRIHKELRNASASESGGDIGLRRGAGAAVPCCGFPVEVDPGPSSASVAFSARRMNDTEGTEGFSDINRGRDFEMRDGAGNVRTTRVCLSTVAVDVFNRARSGERLYLAMHGLSPRVPEYTALIEAARRGVRCDLLLDANTSVLACGGLMEIAERERLEMQIRPVGRTMHQKYLIHPESETVLTGTANMSTDASSRHSEHRFVFRGFPDLTRSFVSDFEEIRRRIPGPS